MDIQSVADSNQAVEIAITTVLGDRSDQQDRFGYLLGHDGAIITICDGMGGCRGGAMASSVAVQCALEAYDDIIAGEDINQSLINAAVYADRTISSFVAENGEPLNSGSTMVTVVVKNRMIHWCSVGDSRAYLCRNGEFVQVTCDQNYRTVLEEQLAAGQISLDEFNRENVRGDALISFLGIGDLQLIDHCNAPVSLMTDDKILLMSDGLYKIAEDDEIMRVISNFNNIQDALAALEMKAARNARESGINRDNMTVALIRVK